MATKTRADRISDELARLEEKKKKLLAQQRSERAREKRADRKLDTRRKVILGAACLRRMQEDEAYNKAMVEFLEKYLTRENDRKLFGLAVSEEVSIGDL